ncbi:hypothetical protein DM01DRAFT_1332483 [Hesseltinella vesiculosa]|uniref:Galactose oxidase n=1 Tax=Hesseltinella vesiculosa TaxID=101127 RepID=A0A1X2GS79_9FUNG|nr:hypothetical protein DM01DRAFT_1332483 [Hesseltinella vesiculosa]
MFTQQTAYSDPSIEASSNHAYSLHEQLAALILQPQQQTISNAPPAHYGNSDEPPFFSLSSPIQPSLPPDHPRYAYASTSTTTHSYVLGGITSNMVLLDDLWQRHNHVWTRLGSHPQLQRYGHLTLPARHGHLLTCFGLDQHHQLLTSCIDFDTAKSTWKVLQENASSRLPPPRAFAGLTAFNTTHALVYGGLSLSNEKPTTRSLGDLWWLDHSQEHPTWTLCMHLDPRPHPTLRTLPNTPFVVIQSQNNPKDLLVIDVEIAELVMSRPYTTPARLVKRALPSSISTEPQQGLSGGALAGLVIGIVVVLAFVIAVSWIVLLRRRQRRQYDLHASRAARFSLASQPPTNGDTLTTAALPPNRYMNNSKSSLAIDSVKSRLSHMSFGSDFHVPLSTGTSVDEAYSFYSASTQHLSEINHTRTLESPSRQLYTNWICETPVPPSSIPPAASISRHGTVHYPFLTEQPPVPPPSPFTTNHPSRRASHATLKRFRLSLFRPNEALQEDPQLKRYTIASPIHEAPSISRQSPSLMPSQQDSPAGVRLVDPRSSLGSRSVLSVQWVDFNNDMDEPATIGNKHLSVMNRFSNVTVSSTSDYLTSDQNTPRNLSSVSQHL